MIIDIFLVLAMCGATMLLRGKENLLLFLLAIILVAQISMGDLYVLNTLCVGLGAVMCGRERPLFPMLMFFGWVFFCFSLRFFDFYSALTVRVAIVIACVLWIMALMTCYVFFVNRGEAEGAGKVIVNARGCRAVCGVTMLVCYVVMLYYGIPFFVRNGVLAMGGVCLSVCWRWIGRKMDFASLVYGCVIGCLLFFALFGGALVIFSDVNEKIAMWGVFAGLAGSLTLGYDGRKRMREVVMGWVAGMIWGIFVCNVLR